jgi:hypothetical protein
MRCPRPIIATSAFAAGACVLLAAGCGGGAGSPGIASIASSTTATTTTTTQSGSGPTTKALGAPGGGRGGQFQLTMKVDVTNGAKFSACMRKNGVTSFPDPTGQGLITIHSGMGIDPGSPAFRSARSVCDKLLPNGGQPTPAQIAQRQKQMLAFSSCMRAHGLKDFPDPSNGGLQIQVHPGSDLSPDNPTFQKAQQACQGDLPFKAQAGTVKSGG